MKQIYDNKDIGEMIDKSFDAGVKEGYRRCKEQMMKMHEQPEVDLEEEVVKYFQGYWPGMKTPEACNHQMVFTTPAIMRMIEHFYELGLNARKEETK